MLKVLAKIIVICVLLPMVVSNYTNIVESVTSPNPKDELIFRVVNGKPASLGTVPYQVSLKHKIRKMGWTPSIYMNFCGGSLIAPDKVLSAGHCFEKKGNSCQKSCKKVRKKTLSSIYSVAGTLQNYDTYESNGQGSKQWRKFKNAFIPQGYWFPKNDIAIAFTETPYILNEHVNILPIASVRKDYGSIECLASGYGMLSKYQKADKLMWAMLRLMPAIKCKSIHRMDMNKFICTENEVTDVLQGDSGGPLVCRNTGDPNDRGKGVIVGVVSGARLIRGRYRTFFTRVTSYQSFIRNGMIATMNLPVFKLVTLSLIISNLG